MLLLHNNQIQQPALCDLCENKHFAEDLDSAISDYIIDNSQKSISNNEFQTVFHISGLAKQHHFHLGNYLRKKFFHKSVSELRLQKGFFADCPIEHHWLQIDNLIIDIAIKQFINQNIAVNFILKELLNDHYCFISDNPENYFYKLYST